PTLVPACWVVSTESAVRAVNAEPAGSAVNAEPSARYTSNPVSLLLLSCHCTVMYPRPGVAVTLDAAAGGCGVGWPPPAGSSSVSAASAVSSEAEVCKRLVCISSPPVGECG